MTSIISQSGFWLTVARSASVNYNTECSFVKTTIEIWVNTIFKPLYWCLENNADYRADCSELWYIIVMLSSAIVTFLKIVGFDWAWQCIKGFQLLFCFLVLTYLWHVLSPCVMETMLLYPWQHSFVFNLFMLVLNWALEKIETAENYMIIKNHFSRVDFSVKVSTMSYHVCTVYSFSVMM